MLECRFHQHAAFWVLAVVACGVVVGMAVHGKLHVQMSHLFVPPFCPSAQNVNDRRRLLLITRYCESMQMEYRMQMA